MQGITLYDEASLAHLMEHQKGRAWDLEKSISWKTAIDLNKPLVPLDENALFFPGASQEQRLAISQMMGLVIATSIFEMEECLLRMRQECWVDVYRQHPVSPEFVQLGEQFFEEEQKHSAAFRRYVFKFAETLGVSPKTLLDLLPKIQNTRTEAILKSNAQKGGQTFWWIVASVEQQFLMLYHALRPFQQKVEPLYYDLHHKHFEEEARHAPFPYLVVELLSQRNRQWMSLVHKKGDLILAQFIQAFWTLFSLKKVEKVGRLRGTHPFFDVLADTYPLFEKRPPHQLLWKFLTSAPYVSPLVNLQSQKKVLRFASRVGALRVPFPAHREDKLVGY